MQTELTARIEAALESLRPFLKADGGDVKLLSISEEKTVKIEFLGACKSCSMNVMTFKAGIEEAIRRAAPEVVSVEAVNMVVAQSQE